MYLPHSQQYAAGYLASALPRVRGYFERHHVQLPLRKGDAAFFNPALFHGAGHQPSADIRGWPTCCRSPRRSAGRWSRWTAPDGLPRRLPAAAPRP